MNRLALVSLIPLSFIACTAIQNVADPPGTLHPDGRISPCHGWESDKQACGNAIHNSRVIHGVEIGQTTDEVLEVMRHRPERRRATSDREEWSYITDYDQEINTVLIFEGGVLVEIDESAWDE